MFRINGLGELFPHPDAPDEVWISSAIPVALFSGQALSFVIDVPPLDDDFPADVGEAVSAFLSLTESDRVVAAAPVFENYRRFLELTDIDPLPVSEAEAIWEFVKVTDVRVSRRHRRDRDVYVQVACTCDWEIEHGLQLVYRRGHTLVRVSDQDGHLTEADAFDFPEPGYF